MWMGIPTKSTYQYKYIFISPWVSHLIASTPYIKVNYLISYLFSFSNSNNSINVYKYQFISLNHQCIGSENSFVEWLSIVY